MAKAYIEISLSAFKALWGDVGLELPLARLDNGRLTDPCKEQLTAALRTFLMKKGWPFRLRAFCAIGVSGVTVRCLSLPPAAKDQFHRLLLLQLENQFPLTPDELAWGSFELDGQRMNRGAATRELLVAALRKEVIEEYSSLLCTCGLNPVFTLAALARSRLCPQRHDSCAILDVTRNHSEWVAFENGVPTAMRIFPWGAEGLNSTDGELDSVSNSIRGLWTGKTIYLTGGGEEQRTLASNLARALSPGVECQALALEQGEGRSAGILGLKKCIEEDQSSIPLALEVKPKPEEGKFECPRPF